MHNYHYIWLIWSVGFLCPWAVLYIAVPEHRTVMWKTSLFMAPFGLTEPLFVPEYWNPPSLFDLAQRTGFDVESIIFSFAIGGIGAVLYNLVMRRRLALIPAPERHDRRHRFHKFAVALPFVLFPVLYFLPWNPIYPAIVAMFAGGIAAVLCRPDLLPNTLLGGVLFLGFYTVFLIGLEWIAPGYIAKVWNLPALSGLAPFGLPLEELLFGFGFGLFWTGLYEHINWHHSVPAEEA